MTAESPPPQDDTGRPPFIKAFFTGLKRNWAMYTMFVVMVMSLAAILVAITGISRTNAATVQLRKLVECQNSYNTINNERTRQLSQALERENLAETEADKALLKVTTVITDPNRSRNATSRAISELRERLNEQEQARAATRQDRKDHPVPPPPEALCGTPEQAIDGP